jgi:hypothetical protein
MSGEITNALVQTLKNKASRGNLTAIKQLAQLRTTSKELRNKIGPMTRREISGLFQNRSIRNKIENDANHGRSLNKYPNLLVFYAVKKLAKDVANRGYRYTLNANGVPTQNGNRMTRANLHRELRAWVNARGNMGNNYVNFPLNINTNN